MDRVSIPKPGGEKDKTDISKAETHNAELNGVEINGAGEFGFENYDSKQHKVEEQDGKMSGVEQQNGVQQNGVQQYDTQQTLVQYDDVQKHDVQHRHDDHHDSKAENVVPEPEIPAIDSVIRERLRISLEHNMPDLSTMCLSAMSDEYPSPNMDDTRGNRPDATEKHTTAAGGDRVGAIKPETLAPFHVMQAVYEKPVPMQSYDNHASMLPLSRGNMPAFCHPIDRRRLELKAPATPTPAHRRPSRPRAPLEAQKPQNSDGNGLGPRARSLEESPGRKIAAMLGRCTAALPAIGTGDLVDAHMKLTKELKRRGVDIGQCPSCDDPRQMENQRKALLKAYADHCRRMARSSKKATAKIDDPFTE